MAMNLGTGGGSGEPEVMMDINTTPLIDVMLVLLIMLIITIPAQLHSVNLDMPVGTPPAKKVDPVVIKIDVTAAGVIHWNRPTTGATGRLPFGGVGISGNHRPGGYFTADSCAYPLATQEVGTVTRPGQIPSGVE